MQVWEFIAIELFIHFSGIGKFDDFSIQKYNARDDESNARKSVVTSRLLGRQITRVVRPLLNFLSRLDEGENFSRCTCS